MAEPQPSLPQTDSDTTATASSLHNPPTEPAPASAVPFISPSPSPPPGPPSPSVTASSSSSSVPPLTPFSSALYDALHPALAHCDAAIDSVFTSQAQLASHIDTLASLLASFNALHRSSSALFTPYTAKLQSAKKRIKRLQTSVDRINSRLNDMRDVVRRKEGLLGNTAAVTGGVGLAGRLSLSSIASIAQQALAVGGSAAVAERDEAAGRGAGSVIASGDGVMVKTADDEEKQDELVAAVGEIESIEALVPVLDKSAAPPTYGSLPTSVSSPTSASSPTASSDTTNGTAAGGEGSVTQSNGVTSGVSSAATASAALPKSSSLSSAPSSAVLLHDLLAWDGQ